MPRDPLARMIMPFTVVFRREGERDRKGEKKGEIGERI